MNRADLNIVSCGFSNTQKSKSIPEQLVELAVSIQCGDFGPVQKISYVIDCGDGVLTIGMAGDSDRVAIESYFMFGLAMKKIEGLV